MIKLNTKASWEQEGLKLTARDLNEFADPLDNLLLDVMVDYYYDKKKKKRFILNEE
ncbi:MAG: hypothetical protein ACM3X9_06860 [Bacillota bacterium]